MTPYRAPLADLRFTLQELSDLDLVCQTPDAQALGDPELRDTVLAQAASFAEQVLAPLSHSGDTEGAHGQDGAVHLSAGFREAQAEFLQGGWNLIGLPAEHGGQGLPIVLCTAVQHLFTAAHPSFCHGSQLTEFAVHAIAQVGGEWQKAQWLPPLVSGRWMATMALTEPQAGRDLGALHMQAQPQADGSHRLFGQQVVVQCAEHDLAENILHLVPARRPGAPAGPAGVSPFVVPKILPDGKRNDLRCTGIEHEPGHLASPTGTMVCGADGTGAVGWRVGREHEGPRAMAVLFNASRLSEGQQAAAMSERACQQALAQASEGLQGQALGAVGAAPTIGHPDVRRLLLTLRCQTEAMRAVACLLGAARDLAMHHPDAALRRSREAFLGLMIPVFAGWATETAIELGAMSTQGPGRSAIQAQGLLERQLVGDGGAALRDWLARVQLTLRNLEEHDEAVLRHIRAALAEATAALRTASERVLARHATRPRALPGGSVPLLCLFGTVLGGWQMARAALAARRHLDTGCGDEAFLRAKIDSAHVYAAHVLPRAAALAALAMLGGDAVLAMAEDAF